MDPVRVWSRDASNSRQESKCPVEVLDTEIKFTPDVKLFIQLYPFKIYL